MKKRQSFIISGFSMIWKSKLFLIMRLTLLATLFAVFQGFAINTYSQNTKLTMKMENTSIKTILNSIEEQTDFFFLYNSKLIDVEQKISINVLGQNIRNVLEQILEGTNIHYEILDRQILLSSRNTNVYQPLQSTIKGQVLDPQKVPLPGVTVVLKGTTQGTITDADGNYLLTKVPGDAVLVFSFVGMRMQEIVAEGRTMINVVMEEEAIGIEEIVFTGYMSQKKMDLTGSVAVMTSNDLEKNPNANALKSLQGKVPGMFITTDGNPAENVSVQIRGLTSMRSAPPLLVIDGLPANINLRDINPNDIASIQVLKDAASASIYGSRAASGGILINTKQGKVGEMRIDYEGYVGISSYMNSPEMLNTEEYGRALWQASVNDGQDPNTMTRIYSYDWHEENGIPTLKKVTPVEWLNADHTMKSTDTDWFKEGTRLGLQNNHQVTVLNGTEKSKQMFSLNFYENQGTQINTIFRRYSMRLNTEYNLINNHLTIGENLTLTKLRINDQNQTYDLLVMPSIVPVHTVDGEGWGGSAMSLGMDDFYNPVRHLEISKNNVNHYFKALGSIYANLTLFKNLNLRTQYGIDYTEGYHRHIDFTWEEAGGKIDDINGVIGDQYHNLNWTWTNTLTYHLNIGKHNLDFLAGMESFKYIYENLYGYRKDIFLEDYDYAVLDAASGTQTVAGGADEYSLLSYFSKFNYVYDSKYLLSATLRYDGSSKFGKNNQFGFFPAFSAGWRMSEEDFLADNKIISDLKLRVSWGMNGNSNIPTNALVTYYDADYDGTSYAIGGNETGTLPSGYRILHRGNDDLKWEATRQTNIGFDFGLWNQRLTGSFDYFHKYTDGMLYEPPYLGAIGEGGYTWINAANMTNTGFELLVTYMSAPNKDFSYSITGNLSSFKNKIDDLPNAVRYTYGGNGLDDDVLGRPLNSIYGFVADGIFKTEDEVDNSPEQAGKGLGRLKFKDLDSDGRITWEHDRTWIGIKDPDFMYGINFNAKYKNMDFSMFWQGITGNDVFNDWKLLSDFWNIGTHNGRNHPTRILNAWTPQNPDSEIPALSLVNPNDEGRVSTYFIESGSYLKLRSIELGYTLPNYVASKLSMKRFRISLSAQNVFNIKKWWGDNAFTGKDPENPGYGYAIPRVFKIGVNVSF
jgi:TonB-linked SusC/RagA family outer membrane protein